MSRLRDLFLALFFVSAATAFGADQDALVLRYLNAKYTKLNAWSGRITHETRSVALGSGRFQEGIIEFQRPNKFRFRLEGSEGSEFVSDGKSAWQLFPASKDRGMLVRRLKSVNNSHLDRYLIFLRGFSGGLSGAKGTNTKESIEKNYSIKTESPAPDSFAVAFSPKAPSEVSEIRIEFKNDSKVFDRVVIKDEVGGETIITLLSHKSVKSFADKHFQPTIPKNATIEDI